MRVWGAVTLDGKPIDEGGIIFTPIDSTQGGSVGGDIKAGKYDLPASQGPIAGGKYKVEILAMRPVGKPLENIIEPGGPPLQASENYIPKRYNANSILTASISDNASKNEFDFKLEGSRPRAKR